MHSLPPVPDRAALAPAKVNSPPCFRCRAARWLEIVEVHTLCFHIKSVFLYKSKTHNQNVFLSIMVIAIHASDIFERRTLLKLTSLI